MTDMSGGGRLGNMDFVRFQAYNGKAFEIPLDRRRDYGIGVWVECKPR